MDIQLVREEARTALRVYQSRTGMSLNRLSEQIRFSYYSLRHLAAGANYDGDGGAIAQATLDFIASHPPLGPETPGRLYPTATTRTIDGLIEYIRRGGWGTLYGPTGGQKTHCLRDHAYRMAGASFDDSGVLHPDEPGMALVEVPGPLSPCALLTLMARAVGAGYAQSSHGLRDSILFTVRARKCPLALVLDEADLLIKSLDALEVLRRLGDALPVRPGRAGIGLLVVGNEDILRLFEPRKGNYFGRWRDRVEQKEVRVIGPTQEEARTIVHAELGDGLPAAVVEEPVQKCTVEDPVSHKKYVSMHRLFHAIEAFRRKLSAELRTDN